MGGNSVIKLVKPIKILGSRTPHQGGIDHFVLSQAEPHIGAADAGILWKADTPVGQKVCRLDSTDCVFYQGAKLLALFVRYRGPEILNLNKALANENDLGDIGNPSNPGVADKLRIQRQQTVRLFGVSARRGFPLQQATLAIEFPDGIDVGDEIVAARKRSSEFHLQISLRLAYADTTVLAKAVSNASPCRSMRSQESPCEYRKS